MNSASSRRSIVSRLIGETNYATLIAIRRARQSRRQETAEDARRAALYARWVRPGDVVFNIGANHGNRTRVFAGLGAHVVALEPQRHCARALRWLFLGQSRVTVIQAAVGHDDSPKMITQFSTDVLSSLSADWIATAQASGRFGEMMPRGTAIVAGITLDQLIARHGTPTFTKIDVEGYEAEVLSGLNRPCGTLSFEVTPEMPQISRACLAKLATLGYTRFQFSSGESMQLSTEWADLAGMHACLDRLAASPADFGDIYALAPGLHS